MERLTSLDAGFLTLESPRVPTHIGSVTILEPAEETLDLAALTERVRARLHLLPPFRRRLVEVPLGLGQPYWIEDPDFDLDFHLRESALAPPGDDRQLADMIARTFSRPLDRTRPLWELWLIHGLKNGRVALFTKIHHAAVDGVSGTELLTALLDEGSEDGDGSGWRGERVPNEIEMLVRGAAELAFAPGRTLRALPKAIAKLPLMPGANLVPGVGGSSAPDTPFNGAITGRRRWAWGGLSLERCKAVKDAADVTLNDVVVTVCAASVRAWLLDQDALPDAPLQAAIPVSVRGDDDGDYGNRIGMMTAGIGTHIDDPLERLRWTAESLVAAKDQNGQLPADTLLDATHDVPPAIASLTARSTLNALGRLPGAPVNLLISNVPGPRDTLRLLGAEMHGLYPVPPIVDGIGLNITVVSYRDVLGMGITTDPEQIADPWPLLDGCVAALDELEAALGAAPPG